MEWERNGAVYYFNGRILLTARLRREIRRVSDQMARTSQALDSVARMDAALGRAQMILGKMRLCAEDACTEEDDTRRMELDRRFQAHKRELDAALQEAGRQRYLAEGP